MQLQIEEYKLESDILKSRYSPRDLAVKLDISLRSLERHFQRQFAMTVKQYLLATRMKHAYELNSFNYKASYVASILGYRQLSLHLQFGDVVVSRKYAEALVYPCLSSFRGNGENIQSLKIPDYNWVAPMDAPPRAWKLLN